MGKVVKGMEGYREVSTMAPEEQPHLKVISTTFSKSPSAG